MVKMMNQLFVANNDKRKIFLGKVLMIMVMFLLVTNNVNAAKCPGEPQTVVGKIYCDNLFTLWVNGEKIVTDPISFTPHQGLLVGFNWDGASSLTYAIQCEDYASESGYEYVDTSRPKLGDGALIAEFDDGLGTLTGSQWKVYTSTFGPTDDSISSGCSADNLDTCEIENRGIPKGWMSSDFDDSRWRSATTYTATEAGWGRTPNWSENNGCCTLTSPINRSNLGCDASVYENACVDPRSALVESKASFIWASDLERDNRVLFRYTAVCE